MATLILLLVLAQYPPESPSITPPTRVLWVERQPDVFVQQDPSQQIDVLYVLSNGVASTQAAADTLCASYEARQNEVLANDPANISRVHKVGCKIITYTAVSDQVDFAAVATTSGSLYAQVNSWRNQLGADEVQFITTASNACGLAYQCAAVYGAQYAYSWVSASCAVGNYTIIHEMGHNVCLNHDAPNNGADPPSFPYSYGFCDNVTPTFHGRRDPMTYPSPCGGNRVSYFGNPDISPFGYPFGDATHNGARVWREQAAAVAAFRAPVTPPTCPTITLVPSTLANGYTGRAYSQTFTATGGTAPYSFALTVGLVNGLSFSSPTYSGTPTTAGTFQLTFRASDSAACTGTTVYTLKILQLPSAPTNLTAVTQPE